MPNHKTVAHHSWWYLKAGLFLLCDIAVVCAVYALALYISYGCDAAYIPAEAQQACRRSLPWFLLLCLASFAAFKMYNSIWRQVSYYELCTFTVAIAIPAILYPAGEAMFGANALPLRYYCIGGVVLLWTVVTTRFLPRLIFFLVRRADKMSNGEAHRRRAMLIGAGAAGQVILRDVMSSNDTTADILCIIDDDPEKWNCNISGVPVVGGRDAILLNAKKYGIQEILFAIPTIAPREKRDILHICQETGCKLRVLPGVYECVNGTVSISAMREVTIEELLGRAPIRVDTGAILDNLAGKTVMVTGGGGSIGSELCRQIARHSPKLLLIFDIYENNAYDIEQELRRTCPELNLKVLIGSVRDTRRIQSVCLQYRPEIIFHAAAHKHVPLMEASPCEAVKNNSIGTFKTACAAILCGCRRFVLISTDKAVNPTNIMGASKRLCEMVIQSMDRMNREHDYSSLPDFLLRHHAPQTPSCLAELLDDPQPNRTEFVAVRFGNVLGSNGSVIPLFKKQIAAGGPVTVTHPDIIRYFMTIPEAVSLVLEASGYAKGGEIFVLDMGEPVKIADLARNLIRLSGYVPDVDVKIAYTGLRPGEKLFEEKLMAAEGLTRTQNDLIHIARPLEWDLKKFFAEFEALVRAAYENEEERCVSIVHRIPEVFFRMEG